jgi:hypothetical protein
MPRKRENTFRWAPAWKQWAGRVDGKRHRLGADEAAARIRFDSLCRALAGENTADCRTARRARPLRVRLMQMSTCSAGRR